MAIIQVHEFTSNAGVTYTINYDDVADSIVTQVAGGTQEATVTAAELGYSEGNIMYSQCEGPDYVKILADLDFPFATRSVDLNSPVCSTGGCDLHITSLVTTEETAPNANDGTMTATAESTNTGIEYSIDGGVTWQPSGSFTNLAPGLYGLSVRDSEGCTAGQIFVIEIFDNPLVSSPAREVSLDNTSRWNAAFNPIMFTYQRRDLVVQQVADGGAGTIIVTVHTDVSTTEYEAILSLGLYLQTEHYEFTGLPISAGLPHNQFKLPIPFTVSDTGGFVNSDALKENYKMITEITSGQAIVSANHTCNAKGVTRADVSSYLRSLLSVDDKSAYDRIVFTDEGLSVKYQVRYRSTWEGFESEWFSVPGVFHATFAAMQLQEHGGGNLMDYVTFLEENNPTKLAGWLTDFEEPVFFLGLPFDLAFILNDELSGQTVYAEYAALDINRQPVPDGITGSFLLNENGGYILNENGSRISIDLNDAVAGFEQISPVPGINRLMVPSGLSGTVKYLTVQLYFVPAEGKKYITQKLTVCIELPCNDPHKYLKWINHLGGWDYYRFGYSQLHRFATRHEVVVRRPVLDWGTADTVNDLAKVSAGDTYRIGAEGVPLTGIGALVWLRKSVKVQLLTDPNPYRWQTVLVQPGQHTVGETRNKHFDVNLTIGLPETNIQHR